MTKLERSVGVPASYAGFRRFEASWSFNDNNMQGFSLQVENKERMQVYTQEE